MNSVSHSSPKIEIKIYNVSDNSTDDTPTQFLLVFILIYSQTILNEAEINVASVASSLNQISRIQFKSDSQIQYISFSDMSTHSSRIIQPTIYQTLQPEDNCQQQNNVSLIECRQRIVFRLKENQANYQSDSDSDLSYSECFNDNANELENCENNHEIDFIKNFIGNTLHTDYNDRSNNEINDASRKMHDSFTELNTSTYSDFIDSHNLDNDDSMYQDYDSDRLNQSNIRSKTTNNNTSTYDLEHQTKDLYRLNYFDPDEEDDVVIGDNNAVCTDLQDNSLFNNKINILISKSNRIYSQLQDTDDKLQKLKTSSSFSFELMSGKHKLTRILSIPASEVSTSFMKFNLTNSNSKTFKNSKIPLMNQVDSGESHSETIGKHIPQMKQLKHSKKSKKVVCLKVQQRYKIRK